MALRQQELSALAMVGERNLVLARVACLGTNFRVAKEKITVQVESLLSLSQEVVEKDSYLDFSLLGRNILSKRGSM